jgi:hypothetical protein
MRSLETLTRMFAIMTVLAASAWSQELPPKIRGYSVHKASIEISQGPVLRPPGAAASVSLGEPVLKTVSPGGISLEIPLAFEAAGQSGKVDFVSFRDLEVDGIAVRIEEFRHPFSFAKGERTELPAPAEVFIPTAQLLRVAYSELRETKKVWNVTGRAFVFGRFRKFGLLHKRVVPIDINITVKNPLLP